MCESTISGGSPSGCVNPAQPDAADNLVMNYVQHTVLPFGGEVSLTCVANTFFESDASKVEEKIECQTDGTFTPPSDRCTSGM